MQSRQGRGTEDEREGNEVGWEREEEEGGEHVSEVEGMRVYVWHAEKHHQEM